VDLVTSLLPDIALHAFRPPRQTAIAAFGNLEWI
jgi:hypothetical protein